jgi:hypothetical protein
VIEPFTFTPGGSDTPFVEGAAFSLPFKAATSLFVVGIGVWLSLVWEAEKAKGGGNTLLVWFLAAFVMCVFFAYWILRSRTRITSEAVHQTWFADKRMPIADLAMVGVLRFRGLEWLVAPRAHVRTLNGKFAVFHAADPKLLAEFERLSRELQAFRQP